MSKEREKTKEKEKTEPKKKKIEGNKRSLIRP